MNEKLEGFKYGIETHVKNEMGLSQNCKMPTLEQGTPE